MDSKVRGHTYKIVKKSFHLDVRINFFLVIELWMHEMNCLSMWLMQKLNSFKARLDKFQHKFILNNVIPGIFKHLDAGCLQVNLMSISAQINQLKYTLLAARPVPDGKMFTLSIWRQEYLVKIIFYRRRCLAVGRTLIRHGSVS